MTSKPLVEWKCDMVRDHRMKAEPSQLRLMPDGAIEIMSGRWMPHYADKHPALAAYITRLKDERDAWRAQANLP